MSRLQPVGQKRLTNVCIVRLKRHGKRFEVAAYRNTVVAWRNKTEKDIDEVLHVHTIYANLDKGILAKSEDMLEAFGTDDEDIVCVEVLDKGDFQVSEEERQMMVEALFRDIASRVSDMCVNPDTQRPHPLSTIERAMRETLHFTPATNRSAKMQALQVIRQLEGSDLLPIERAKMQLRLVIPGEQLQAMQVALRALDADSAMGRLQPDQPEPTADGSSYSIRCIADTGLFRRLSDMARDLGSTVHVIEMKTCAEAGNEKSPVTALASNVESTEANLELLAVPPPAGLPAHQVDARQKLHPPVAQLDVPSARRTAAVVAASSSIAVPGVVSGRSTQSREERMFKLNLRSAERGDPVAQFEVGKAYVDGMGVESDSQQGKHWLEQAAQQGVNAAACKLQALSL